VYAQSSKREGREDVPGEALASLSELERRGMFPRYWGGG
jgi:hypothetical protein